MNDGARRALRTAILDWLYQASGGAEGKRQLISEFRVPLLWEGDMPSPGDISDAVNYLVGDLLVTAQRAWQGLISVQLTHAGIRQVETSRHEYPGRATGCQPYISCPGRRE